MRYFTPWLRATEWEEFHLPKFLQKLQGSTHVPFGDCVISTPDSCFGAETCEEMWSPDAPRMYQAAGLPSRIFTLIVLLRYSDELGRR
jgi:NAD+ synthase (glutamine-hydrolysing)